MVVDDVGSSHGESVVHVAVIGGRELCGNSYDIPVEKLERSEEDARWENPKSVLIKTACVAAELGVQSSVLKRL